MPKILKKNKKIKLHYFFIYGLIAISGLLFALSRSVSYSHINLFNKSEKTINNENQELVKNVSNKFPTLNRGGCHNI